MSEQPPEAIPNDADEAGNGVAVPDEPAAEAAQDGVQTAFEVAPE